MKRNSQTVLNVAFNGLTLDAPASRETAPMFWDMRVRTLESQALEPLKALEEMRGNAYPEERALAVVISRLEAIGDTAGCSSVRLLESSRSVNRISRERWPRFSGPSSRRGHLSIATCAAMPTR